MYCLPVMGLVHLIQSSSVVSSYLQMTRHFFFNMDENNGTVCASLCSWPSSAAQEADIKVEVVLRALVKLPGYL